MDLVCGKYGSFYKCTFNHRHKTIQVKYSVSEKKVYIDGQTIMMKVVSNITDEISLNNRANYE
ncbi:hypothetical protein HWB19_gp123 [Cronobacter phage vB_CsaP_009]|uniref:Uncharacterized protein n=1 Tax=Cronobacter phage vB_CsaP_009 TaxID=2699738 RepID=A0A679FE26_9CAUD|nr:hypothetical protein HWB19_gp123 [Cronobacter phage vB_CsaP_009]BBU72769.1 hypothetical protein [Cronobacter phage vB_CsaP_009]